MPTFDDGYIDGYYGRERKGGPEVPKEYFLGFCVGLADFASSIGLSLEAKEKVCP